MTTPDQTARRLVTVTGSLLLACGLALLQPLTQVEAAPSPAPRPTPGLPEATVHDPDHIEVNGRHYFFGSHLQSASTTDLVNLRQDTAGVTSSNPLFDDVTTELSEALTWAQTDTLWAPDVVQLDDGRIAMFYDACRGDSPRSALGIATADSVEGPYADQGIILKSGMWDQIRPDGTVYDARVHPNTVDPDVFRDAGGGMWMVYGSYSGGIFVLQLHPSSGIPLPGQGYGRHVWGGNHARIEGPAMYRDPATGWYYLFVTYGGLDSTGGYNVRVARSKSPAGPFLDATGRDMATVKSDPSKPLFDDDSIENSGVKLMGSAQFDRVVGDPGTGAGQGHVSPGGVSPFVDRATGRLMIAFHTRFPGRGEEHEVRIHTMTIDAAGWPEIAPLRHAGEGRASLKRADEVGSYAVVDHAPLDINADIHHAQQVNLNQDGTVTGAITGTWVRDGQNHGWLTTASGRQQLTFARQWDADQQAWTTTITSLSSATNAVSWWVRKPRVSSSEAVARVIADLSVPATTISNLSLPVIGTQQSSIVWSSDQPAVIGADGTVTRPPAGQADARVHLTAIVSNGTVTRTTTFLVTVPATQAPGLRAQYSFEGSRTEATGQQADGTPTGARIDQAGGQPSYVPGVRGQALAFDGSTGVRLPDGLVGGPTWSVSLWLKPDATTPYTTTFFAARDTTHWVSLVPQGHSGVGGDTMVWSGTGWFDGGFGLKLPVGQWSHVALSVDNGHVMAWVDGVTVLDRTGFPEVLTTSAGTFALGVNWWDTPYRGAMDEVQVRDAALTQSEVNDLATP